MNSWIRNSKTLGRKALASARDTQDRIKANFALVRGLGQYNIKNPVGRCLVSYVPWFVRYLNNHPEVGPRGWDPVTLPAKMERLARPFSSHTMHWESAEMVRQFIERRFIVDVIFAREGYLLKDVSEYDVIVDEWDNLERWESSNPHAKKLYYATGCHWLFHNQAELTRHAWLFARRSIALPTARQIPPQRGLEHARLISSFGNHSNKTTFGEYASRIRKLWISAVHVPTGFKPKSWKTARKNFLYFGSTGWVHRGLDLVIEAFLQEPDLNLTICSGDEGFRLVYEKEIARARNIFCRGRLDPLEEEFEQIGMSTSAIVMPSASEGCSGSVVQCLHYGLIPVATEVTGIEVFNRWQPLAGNNDISMIECIRQRCRQIADLPEADLEELSQFFRTYAHTYHTRATYSQSLHALLDELLGSRVDF